MNFVTDKLTFNLTEDYTGELASVKNSDWFPLSTDMFLFKLKTQAKADVYNIEHKSENAAMMMTYQSPIFHEKTAKILLHRLSKDKQFIEPLMIDDISSFRSLSISQAVKNIQKKGHFPSHNGFFEKVEEESLQSNILSETDKEKKRMVRKEELRFEYIEHYLSHDVHSTVFCQPRDILTVEGYKTAFINSMNAKHNFTSSHVESKTIIGRNYGINISNDFVNKKNCIKARHLHNYISSQRNDIQQAYQKMIFKVYSKSDAKARETHFTFIPEIKDIEILSIYEKNKNENSSHLIYDNNQNVTAFRAGNADFYRGVSDLRSSQYPEFFQFKNDGFMVHMKLKLKNSDKKIELTHSFHMFSPEL